MFWSPYFKDEGYINLLGTGAIKKGSSKWLFTAPSQCMNDTELLLFQQLEELIQLRQNHDTGPAVGSTTSLS
jgi:hypothetical protein